MISYLKGSIIVKKQGFVILLVNGVGYEVFVSEATMKKLPNEKENLDFFCHLDVGERSLKLFGFLTYQELELFKIIRNIQGVGPKASLEISSIGSLEKIQQELEKPKADFLNNIPGIGPKKASKIILELSGEIKKIAPTSKKAKDDLETDEAFLALINLGLAKEKVKQVFSQLPHDMSTDEKVKQALKLLGK